MRIQTYTASQPASRQQQQRGVLFQGKEDVNKGATAAAVGRRRKQYSSSSRVAAKYMYCVDERQAKAKDEAGPESTI